MLHDVGLRAHTHEKKKMSRRQCGCGSRAVGANRTFTPPAASIASGVAQARATSQRRAKPDLGFANLVRAFCKAATLAM